MIALIEKKIKKKTSHVHLLKNVLDLLLTVLRLKNCLASNVLGIIIRTSAVINHAYS